MEISEHEISEWFEPRHFKLGETVFIMGRRFLLQDCDEFTKEFYRINFGVQDFTPVDATKRLLNLKKKVMFFLPDQENVLVHFELNCLRVLKPGGCQIVRHLGRNKFLSSPKKNERMILHLILIRCCNTLGIYTSYL